MSQLRICPLSCVGFLVLLGIALPASRGVDDAKADPLQPGAIARFGTTFLRHGHGVSELAFFSDGKTLASCAGDFTARTWDLDKGQALKVFGGEEAKTGAFSKGRFLTHLALSPDNKLMATTAQGQKEIIVWDTSAAKQRYKIPHNAFFNALVFSPDGTILAATSADNMVHLYTASDGKPLRQLTGHTGYTYRVAFTPDGKTLASCGFDQTIRLWETESGKLLNTIDAKPPAPKAGGVLQFLLISKDGKSIVSADSAGNLAVWSLPDRKRLFTLDTSSGPPTGIAFLPDGKTIVATSRYEGAVKFFDVTTGKKAREFDRRPGAYNAMTVSPDGKTLALGGQFGAIRLWDIESGKETSQTGCHQGYVNSLVASGDGTMLVSISNDWTVRLWQIADGKETAKKALDWDQGEPIALSSDGKMALAANSSGLMTLIDSATGKGLRTFSGHSGGILAATMSEDGSMIATGGSDQTVRVWDVPTGKQATMILGQVGPVRRLAFVPNRKVLIIACANNTLRLVDVVTGKDLYQPIVAGPAHRLAVSLDGRILASGNTDGVVRVWDLVTGSRIYEFPAVPAYIMSLAFASDGRTLAAGHWMGIKLWDLATGEERGVLSGFAGDAMSLAFLPDGKTLASGVGDSTILLWDLAKVKPLKVTTTLSEKELDAFWADLGSDDFAKSYKAEWGLKLAAAQALQQMGKHLKPTPALDRKKIAKLVADLDADKLEVRSKAMEDLEKMGPPIAGELRKIVEMTTDVDVRLRLFVVLGKIGGKAESGGDLQRSRRAVQVLEQVGNADAKKLLRLLGEGAEESELTIDAKAALARLEARAGK